MMNFTTVSAFIESHRELKKKSPPILDLYHFPILKGRFHENMMNFLRNCCIGGGESRFWMSYVFDREKKVVLPIYVIEDLPIEEVDRKRRNYCLHCRFHACPDMRAIKETYHILIPAEDRWSKPPVEDLNLDDDTHLLHGLIHSHGRGHLACTNAGTSIPDTLINDIWTRLCAILRTGPCTGLLTQEEVDCFFGGRV